MGGNIQVESEAGKAAASGRLSMDFHADLRYLSSARRHWL